ncbi:MAG: amino acid ABC transporter substrate-binding protein [Candidatus Accumulibacter sp.]|nr:amino acid ABC transporter substrate-binding protein [Accumulibacter sp.]
MPAEAPADAPTETTPAPDAASLPASIVIGLDDHFPPMGFRDDKNEIVGFDIDLAREAGKRLGIEVIFKPIDWSAKEAELTGKRIDMLWNGLTITEERKANILFTQPYVQNSQIIMVTESSPIKLKADLAGKIVGAQDGSSAIDAIERDAETAQSFGELKKFSDNVTALMDLSAGRLDAVVVDEIVGRYYAAKKVGEYRILDENFGTEEYGVGLRKEDTELAARIDKVLDDIKADGTGTSISTQWFGADILKR